MSNKAKLKQLQSVWYEKLKTSGFEDLEQADGNLKSWASSAFSQALRAGQIDALRARESYYRAAGHFLYEYKFDNEVDRKIWEMHAAGMFAIDISISLNLPRKGKDAIRNTINRLARIMGGKCPN